VSSRNIDHLYELLEFGHVSESRSSTIFGRLSVVGFCKPMKHNKIRPNFLKDFTGTELMLHKELNI
jgi:hypothetical protein